MLEIVNPEISLRQRQAALPSISIITPSLNQGKFIEATIQSVLSQKYPQLEYLIMDGGSTDNTKEILAKYTDQLMWISEKDYGQTHAINKGLRATKGDIVSYLNADDFLLPNALSLISRVFIENPQASWVTGQCIIVDEINNDIRRPIAFYKNMLLRYHLPSFLLITNYISQPATFWRRSVMEESGYLDEHLHYIMDYEYWLRLSKKHMPVVIPKNLAAFKIHHNSKTTSTGHKKAYIDEEREIIRKYTGSKILLLLHDLHRFFMTSIYAVANRGKQ